MKKIITTIVISLSISSIVQAQDTDLLENRFKKYAKAEKSKLSKSRQMFSWDWKFSFITDFFGTLPRTYEYMNNETGEIYTSTNQTTIPASMFGVGFEPRWNLFNRDQNAFGIKLATHANFSFVQHMLTEGVLHGSQGFFLFYGRNYGGPFNNISESGFAISAGMVSVFAPIFGFSEKRDFFLENYTPLPGSRSYASQVYFLPAIQFDLYSNSPLRTKPMVTSITLGYSGRSYLIRFNFGLPF